MPNVKIELYPNVPRPKGMCFETIGKVNIDHALDAVFRSSRTMFIVHLNISHACLCSKKQNSVESGTFGSEFIAMKQLCECLRGLRYTLQMMGMSCEGPALVFEDKQSVLCGTYTPDRTLNKSRKVLIAMLLEKEWIETSG